ncbi:MAG TPA: M1 family metallopeptidase [Nocardia sp.]|uniref:M1 family metallopeptidase n=1 Tax=Nocardia sp. TaxID=1821 RepID=UPI002B4AB9D9|nr:M1 family metallopeptidase [Nocardia sp.]HLS76220.1 M1 family metallopeptidase [Nocardia sp.]
MRSAVLGAMLAGVLLVGPGGAVAQAGPFTGAPGLGDPYYPLDGNGGYDVRHYDLDLAYDPPSRRLDGTARIDAVSTQPLRAFNLDYQGPAVTAVTVNRLPAAFERNGEHELTVTPLLPLLPGLPFTVEVRYGGEVTENAGAGWTFTPGGGAFVAGEPHAATSWYPLNDTPLDKATFTLRATVPVEWQVASIGRRTADTVTGGSRTVTWESREPVVGYLTTVAVDRFTFLDQRRADGTPLLSAFAPGARDKTGLERRVPEIIDFAEQLFGPYPFDTAGGIHLDTDLPFSLETQTRPLYAPWADLNTVVHEIAHQWWGNAVTLRSWSDICLHECFAAYTADILWPERTAGVDADALYQAALDELGDGAEIWQIPLYDPGAGREFGPVYYRGPLFLHALRRAVGDRVFFAALPEFLARHAYGNASMADFRAFVQSRTDRDLTGFFTAWLEGTTRPPAEYLHPAQPGPRG